MFNSLIRLSVVILSLATTFCYAADISLRDKIGQMIMIGFDERELTNTSEIATFIETYNIGGIIFSIDDLLALSKDKTPFKVSEIAAMTRKLQNFAKAGQLKYHRPRLPLLIATDEEGGRIDRFRTVDGLEPTLPASLYASISPEKRQHEVNKISSYLKKMGFNLDLAPVVDININPQNPIIGHLERSYSDSPELVVENANVLSKALLKRHIQCVYKHFPGHGSAQHDSHLGFVDVTKSWRSLELFPYLLMSSKPNSCQVVMTAHLVNKQLDPSGKPATLSYPMLTLLLRQHFHFKGVIISDDMQMKAISDNYTLQQSIPMAINAGVDILLYSERKKFPFKNPGELIDLIESKVKSGEILKSRIDDAYRRIVKLKKG